MKHYVHLSQQADAEAANAVSRRLRVLLRKHRRRILLAGLLAEMKRHVRKCLKRLEARVGFEPTNGGFADLSLGPLGYRAKLAIIPNLQCLPGAPRLVASDSVKRHLPIEYAADLTPVVAAKEARASWNARGMAETA